MSKSEEKFLTEARNRRRQAIDATADNRRVQMDDVKFAAASPDNGWQWPEQIRQQRMNDKNGARPCLTINKLPQHIKLVTNEQRQNRPSCKVLPVDDKGDPEVAEILNGIIRHIEVNSDADVAYDTACENQVTHGEGFFRVVTDYCTEDSFEQDILIRRIRNSFSVDMDPNIQDPAGADAEWCFVSDLLSEDDFKRQYPKAQPISWDVVGQGDEFNGWFDGDEKKVRIAEYFWFKDEQKKLYLWATGEVSAEGDELPPGVVVGEKPIKERTTTIRKVMWTKMNGCQVLQEQEWAGKYIPVIRVVGNEYEVDGKIIVSGLVRNAKDPQRMVNYWTSQEAEMLALAPKAPFVGAVGQFEGQEEKWRTANSVNYAYLEYNPMDVNGTLVPRPERQAPPMPPAGIINAKLGSADDLQSTVGQYNPSLGAEAKEKSGRAILARQQQADVGTYHYIDNLSRAIRHCGRILVDMIPKIYDTERVARILGEDGEPDRVKINPEQPVPVMQEQDERGEIRKIYNPGVGRYDVTVVVGPAFTTKRQEAAAAMGEVLQGNPALWQVAGDLFVKNLDWPGAEELAERIRKTMDPKLLNDDDDQPPEMQQAMAVIDQLQQQSQAMQGVIQELQQGMEAQRLDVERFNAETKRMQAESAAKRDASAGRLDEAKVREIIFDVMAKYVQLTPQDDTALLAGAVGPAPTGGME